MKIYLVGGAVRDQLLGVENADDLGTQIQTQDRDYVVVGATPADLLARGFKPVGQDFPVFLHPVTHAEYALARTERKTAPGYKGFVFHAAPNVTLEQDLQRRDLTINAMAREVLSEQNEQQLGPLIDPYGGQQDLQQKLLRHVGPAFVEDPLRILRVARFAARFPAFQVAPETLSLMQHIVAQNELAALVPERIWQEISRGLMSQQPARMFEVLQAAHALEKILPEIAALQGIPQRAEYHPEIDTYVHVMMVLEMCARLQASLPVRFAALTHDLGKATTPLDVLPRHIGHEARSVQLLEKLCKRLRIPNECRDVALVTAREHGNIHQSLNFSAEAIVRLLERCDAWRKPARFAEVLQACEADARGRLGFTETPYPQAARLQAAFAATQRVDTAAHAAQYQQPEDIRRAIFAARCRAVEHSMNHN